MTIIGNPSIHPPSGAASSAIAPHGGERRCRTAAAHHGERISALDGFRGLACCGVLLVHFTPDYQMPNRPLEWAKNLLILGGTGLDMFFVLSGMLITEMLLRSRGTQHAARNFYMRRFLRVMPLYFGSLIFVFVLLPLFVPHGSDPRFDVMQSKQGWHWLCCTNLLKFFHGDGPLEADTVVLTHLWSLSVEEHFYLLWPLLVWKLGDRKLLWACASLIILALGFRIASTIFLPGKFLSQAFFQTPMRMDALALGAVLALAFRHGDIGRLRRAAIVLLPIMLAVLAALATFAANDAANLTVIAIVFSCSLILLRTASPASVGLKVVDNPFFRFFGKYSYGIYVLHGLGTPLLDRLFPAYAFLMFFGSPVLASLLCVCAKVALSVAAALVSWRLLEHPCLKLKKHFEYESRPVVAATGAHPS